MAFDVMCWVHENAVDRGYLGRQTNALVWMGAHNHAPNAVTCTIFLSERLLACNDDLRPGHLSFVPGAQARTGALTGSGCGSHRQEFIDGVAGALDRRYCSKRCRAATPSSCSASQAQTINSYSTEPQPTTTSLVLGTRL